MSGTLPGFGVIIPAGGAGKRLWPISQPNHPKFLLDLTGSGRTLIQQTWDRLVPLAGADRMMVVTGAGHRDAVATQLPGLEPANLITEPGPRDSMAAIGLAAAIAQRRWGDLVVGSFAADHVIKPAPGTAGDAVADRVSAATMSSAADAGPGRASGAALAAGLEPEGAAGLELEGAAAPGAAAIGGGEGFAGAVQAAYLAAQEGLIATIGIEPTSASTAYGYISAGDPIGLVGFDQIRFVKAFQEKPDLTTATKYVAAGYRWNAGMFVFRASVLLRWLGQLHPEFADGIGQLADAWDTAQRGATAKRIWPHLPAVAIDRAIAEPVAALGAMATVPGDFAWSDVGDFDSVAQLVPDGSVQLGAGPPPVLEDSPGALAVSQTTQLVVVAGLPDAVVAVSDGVVLVTRRERAQGVKALADRLGDRV
ncbi:MAG: hypothetical protein LBE08_10235 [Bifidobacteriaceae bacterium]|jgi:mannose-1-phosphate guanylyltransferase|nr:hypothetical protein [Bifidobacteriaceae bacterium]